MWAYKLTPLWWDRGDRAYEEPHTESVRREVLRLDAERMAWVQENLTAWGLLWEEVRASQNRRVVIVFPSLVIEDQAQAALYRLFWDDCDDGDVLARID